MLTLYLVKFKDYSSYKVGFKMGDYSKEELEKTLTKELPRFNLIHFSSRDISKTEAKAFKDEVKIHTTWMDGSAIKKPKSKNSIGGAASDCFIEPDLEAIKPLFSEDYVFLCAIPRQGGSKLYISETKPDVKCKAMPVEKAERIISLLDNGESNKQPDTSLNFECVFVVDKCGEAWDIKFSEEPTTSGTYYKEVLGQQVKGKIINSIGEHLSYVDGLYYGDVDAVIQIRKNPPKVVEGGRYIAIIDEGSQYRLTVKSQQPGKNAVTFRYYDEYEKAVSVRDAILSSVNVIGGTLQCFEKNVNPTELFDGIYYAYIESLEHAVRFGITSKVSELEGRDILVEKLLSQEGVSACKEYLEENFEKVEGKYIFSDATGFYSLNKFYKWLTGVI